MRSPPRVIRRRSRPLRLPYAAARPLRCIRGDIPTDCLAGTGRPGESEIAGFTAGLLHLEPLQMVGVAQW